MVMFSMESNVLKIYRHYPASNSRRLKEAILLVFHRINGYLKGEQDDVSRFESPENLRLRDALLMAFDPFTNEEVKDVLSAEGLIDLQNTAELQNYFKEPVQCIRRIYDSVEHWEKRSGSNGYFDFVEGWMGSKIEHDDKMNYTIGFAPEKAAKYFE